MTERKGGFYTITDQPIKIEYGERFSTQGGSPADLATRERADSDDADESDVLEARRFYHGLANFIKNCTTPMTIAIQGDWGSGKTSAMNYINYVLTRGVDSDGKGAGGKYKTIYFNTWQYDQFNMGEKLVFSLIKEISRNLEVSGEDANVSINFSKIVRGLGKAFKKGGEIAFKVAAEKIGGDTGLELSESFLEKLKGDGEDSQKETDDEEDLAYAIKNVKSAFAKLVEASCQHTGSNRVVVFIDDLDRLDPVKALEVMEALKIVLECERCVFVLAIDFKVVASGTREKYGSEFSERKARAFFDKIIQVPFTLPTHAYKPQALIGKYLESSAPQLDDKQKETFVNLIKWSVGKNPRSIKRLLNTLTLLMEIDRASAGDEDLTDARRYLATFSLVCSQSVYPEFHRELLVNMDAASVIMNAMDDQGEDEASQFIEEIMRKNKFDDIYEAQNFIQFCGELKSVFSDDAGNFDEELIDSALRQSSITSVGGINADKKEYKLNRAPNLAVRKFAYKIFNRLAAEPLDESVLGDDEGSRLTDEERTRPLKPGLVKGDSVVYYSRKRQGVLILSKNGNIKIYLAGDTYGDFPNFPWIRSKKALTKDKKEILNSLHLAYRKDLSPMGGNVEDFLKNEDEKIEAFANILVNTPIWSRSDFDLDYVKPAANIGW